MLYERYASSQGVLNHLESFGDVAERFLAAGKPKRLSVFGKPEKSSVPVSIAMMSLFTGWEKRLDHFMSDAFFGATEADLVNFSSTSVKVTGTDTAIITGDLTLNDITKSVDLNAVLHATGFNSRRETDWAGFTATITLLRSDFGLGLGAPSVSDKVDVQISI